MRYREILKEMTVDQAMAIFRHHGVDPLTTNLKAARKKLVMQNHPDRGGDNETMAQINAAYDVLAKGTGTTGSNYSTSSRRDSRPTEHGTPIWAMAGHSGGMPPSASIYRQDYRDVNYIKKQMWELSKHSKQEWTIWGFDGAFLRGVVTVYGSPAIFRDMAEAMVTWQTKGGNPYPCRAVLVQKGRSSDMQLIWADGIFYGDKPISVEHESFNRNPSNDRSFEPRLRKLIDQLREEARGP